MTGAERVYRAIARKAVDRVPKGEWRLAPALIAGLLGKEGPVGWEDEVAARELLGMDLVALAPAGPPPAAGAPGAAGLDYSLFRRWRSQTDFFVFALIDGPFQGVARRMDFTDFLLRVGSRDEGIEKLALEEADFTIEVARYCLKNGAHGVIIADDIAYTRGLYVNPVLLRELFLPLWRRQAGVLKAGRVPVFFHSDGNIMSLLPDLVAAGFTGLHSLEPAAGMDIARIKSEYGANLCLMGNIDLDFLVKAEREEEIAAGVRRLMAVASPGGGFIFSTSSGCLGDDLPPAKVLALYRSAGKYGTYPDAL